MFRAIDRLQARLRGAVEFHYVGTSDPHRFAEFAAIEHITIRHGFKDAAGMAATLASMHAGILTSEFEGMPRFVLETLAVGRPVVAMHLPQLESVIHEARAVFWWRATTLPKKWPKRWHNVSSMSATPSTQAKWIRANCRRDSGLTPSRQLARVFRYHQEIQTARGMAVAAPAH